MNERTDNPETYIHLAGNYFGNDNKWVTFHYLELVTRVSYKLKARVFANNIKIARKHGS